MTEIAEVNEEVLLEIVSLGNVGNTNHLHSLQIRYPKTSPASFPFAGIPHTLSVPLLVTVTTRNAFSTNSTPRLPQGAPPMLSDRATLPSVQSPSRVRWLNCTSVGRLRHSLQLPSPPTVQSTSPSSAKHREVTFPECELNLAVCCPSNPGFIPNGEVSRVVTYRRFRFRSPSPTPKTFAAPRTLTK